MAEHLTDVTPSARRTLCVDFDATLYPWGHLMSYADPLPGAVEAMKKLKAAGYRIVIFTSRLSLTWLVQDKQNFEDQYRYIRHQLERDGIPYDHITAEKVPAHAYIDDRGFRFEGDWNAVLHFLNV